MSRADGQAVTTGDAADAALRDWEAVRANPEIQFAPVRVDPPKNLDVPEWIKAISRFFRAIFEPIAEALGLSWPVLQWMLIALAAAGLLLLTWRLFEQWGGRPRRAAAPEPAWTPDRSEALALLEDADRLAAAGRFDEAAHLLLRRSIGQIAAAQPDWVHPASTAREIAAQSALPAAARSAFAIMAQGVERSRYALQQLGLEDWQSARAAYAAFALERLPA